MKTLPLNTIAIGDVRKVLHTLPSASVDCIVTSPPYFQLRNYQQDGQIGLEGSVDDWTEQLRGVLKELQRVLTPTGSLWLNLGDSYSRHARFGAPPKSLLLGPERVLLALIEDGWIIRNKIVWAKPNPMPASVGDRLNCTWEVVYIAVRSRHYYFSLDTIRVPHRSRRRSGSPAAANRARRARQPDWAGPLAGSNRGLLSLKGRGLAGHPLGKNPGDVWSLPTANFRGAHHAVFPTALVRRALLAGCPQRVCPSCSLAWRRSSNGKSQPVCQCASRWRNGRVLDPFIGAGTVGVVAEGLGLDWVGIEINPTFAALARRRIEQARAELPVQTSADVRAAA